MSGEKYPGQESAVPSQAQPRFPAYTPSPNPADAPKIPPGPPGTIPTSGFVVSTFDARPIDTDDFVLLGTNSANTDPNTPTPNVSYNVASGSVLVLRSIGLNVYVRSGMEPPYNVLNGFYTTLHGLTTDKADLRLDVTANGVPVPGLSDLPIAGADLGGVEVECYALFEAETFLVATVRFGPNVDANWALFFEGAYIDLQGSLLTDTGRSLSAEPSSRQPVPTIDGVGYGGS